METTKSLLDEVKTAKNIQTDYALAKTLNLHSGLISDYYSGKRIPNEFACMKIAEALNCSYEEVTALIRIESEKDEKRREEWVAFYQKITAPHREPSNRLVARGRIELPTRGFSVRCSTN